MAKKQSLAEPRRGQVYLVNFDLSTAGAEIQKVRPALIIQNDISNYYNQTTIVAAISSQSTKKVYSNQAFIAAGEGGLKHDSLVLLQQIRTIDKSRLGPCLGMVKTETLRVIDQALQISLGLVG